MLMVPGVSGVFDIRVEGAVVWSRAAQNGFPDIKELKQIVRDRVAPGKPLGHSEKSV